MVDRNNKTIIDFGNQWIKNPANDGYYGSMDMFKDICGLLMDINEIFGKST